jgi:hypothetical protein
VRRRLQLVQNAADFADHGGVLQAKKVGRRNQDLGARAGKSGAGDGNDAVAGLRVQRFIAKCND